MSSPLGVKPSCTGLTAMWCPAHGSCACPVTPDWPGHLSGPLNAPGCPLHGTASTHPLIPYAAPEGAARD